MAFIQIHELRPAGTELFQDSESFLNELNDQEALSTVGAGGNSVESVLSANNTIGISIVSKSLVTQSLVVTK